MEVFNPVAAVASIRLCRDRETGNSRGYAYVNFTSPDDALRAMETLNYTMFSGAPCRIMWANRDKSARSNTACNIVLKGLLPNVGPKVVHDSMSTLGTVVSCKVPFSREKNEFLGYGFVQFEKEEDARAAVEDYNNAEFEGAQIAAEMFRTPEERAVDSKWTNVYVKQYPRSFGEAEIRALLEPVGAITSLFIPVDAEGKPKGFCFANFESSDAAKRAVADLNGKEVSNPDHVPATDEAAAAGGPAKLTLSLTRALPKADRKRNVAAEASRKKSEFQRSVEGRNLYVKNLDERVDDDALKAFFSKHGTVTSTSVKRDENGRSLLFGFVCFSSASEAEAAVVAANKSMLEGKPLYVAMWQPKSRREAHLRQTHRAPAMGPGRMAPGYPGMAAPGYSPAMMQMYNMRAVNPQQAMHMSMGMRYGMHMGGGYPMQPQAPMQGQPQMPPQVAPPSAASAAVAVGPPAHATPSAAPALTSATLAAMDPTAQRRMIGGRLFPLVQRLDSARAPKLTGMILDGREVADLLSLLESEEELKGVVAEAQVILDSRSG